MELLTKSSPYTFLFFDFIIESGSGSYDNIYNVKQNALS